jgi:signal peptidase I
VDALNQQPKRRWWSTTVGIISLTLSAALIAGGSLFVFRTSFRLFYIPSEAMLPLLKVNDRITANMWSDEPVARGDVVLLAVQSTIYIKRVIGMPGDRIALINGVPTINGTALIQTAVRTEIIKDPAGQPQQTKILRETLPGGNLSYLVADMGAMAFDEFPEVTVPAGHYFLLGDNRDNSADSRVPEEDMGVGMVAQARIRGKARSIVWRTGEGFVDLPVQPVAAPAR